MRVFRVMHRPDMQIADRVIEADEVSWPDEDWGMVGFYNGKFSETLVAAIRYDFIAAVVVDQQ